MNMISWFLYLADVIGNISTLFGVMLLVLVVALVLLWFFRVCMAGSMYDHDLPSEKHPEGTADYRKWMSVKNMTERKSLYVWLIILAVSATLLPSKKTFYLIAASQSAEVVVKNQEVQEIFNDLTSVIKSELKGMIAKPAKE